MRERCIQGVADQSVGPVQHLVVVDGVGVGPALARNQLLAAASTKWIAFCDDDDWFLPFHLELLLAAASGADVVVGMIRLENRPEPLEHRCDFGALKGGNWFHPSACLLRRSAVMDVHGFSSDAEHEDWDLWRRLLHAGAVFQCVHQVTNVKGVHLTNRTGPRL